MWLVKNTLHATLRFPRLDLAIGPRAEFDLDQLGREIAEVSRAIRLAFDEGYLQNLRKEPTPEDQAKVLEESFESFKQSLISDIGNLNVNLAELRQSIVGDIGDMLQNLRVARSRIQEERERVLVDTTLDETETRARLAFLEEQEKLIETKFQEIGRQDDTGSDQDISGKADLLSNL